jgi:hypothetical protein
MKAGRFLIVVVFGIALLSNSGPRASSAKSPDGNRVRFLIDLVEMKSGTRTLLSEQTVEGPQGTDFDVNLESGPFRMKSQFVTDPIGPSEEQIRVKLDTRRLYGYSERNLPLYEEDEQNQTLQMGFDEAIVLLPFGKGGDDQLRLEISPAISQQAATLPSGVSRPLEIKILAQSPGAVISVEASKRPHHYIAELSITENGKEIAHASTECFLLETRQVVLQPGGSEGQGFLAVVSVNKYLPGLVNQADFSFDLYGGGQGPEDRKPIATNWAGIAALGSVATYELTDAANAKRELRIKISLAPGETVY